VAGHGRSIDGPFGRERPVADLNVAPKQSLNFDQADIHLAPNAEQLRYLLADGSRRCEDLSRYRLGLRYTVDRAGAGGTVAVRRRINTRSRISGCGDAVDSRRHVAQCETPAVEISCTPCPIQRSGDKRILIATDCRVTQDLWLTEVALLRTGATTME
jgi:hypothetical protein